MKTIAPLRCADSAHLTSDARKVSPGRSGRHEPRSDRIEPTVKTIGDRLRSRLAAGRPDYDGNYGPPGAVRDRLPMPAIGRIDFPPTGAPSAVASLIRKAILDRATRSSSADERDRFAGRSRIALRISEATAAVNR